MNVAVVFGGESCEHDISIITGVQLINNLNRYLYNVIPIYIDKNGNWLTGEALLDIDNYPNNLVGLNQCTMLPNDNRLWRLNKKGTKIKSPINIDVAFLCLHGIRGEDGTIASIFELSKVPYFASGICASSVCMDKSVFKYFAKGLGVPVVEGIEITEDAVLSNQELVFAKVEGLGYPVIVKPARQGSSIGITVCDNKEDLSNAITIASKYDNSIVIEKYINIKKEVNIAVFENKGEYILSNTEEPITADKFLNFDDKYRQNPGGFETIKRIVPAGISKEQNKIIVDIVTSVYKALKMAAVVRFDFLIDKEDNVYLNEVNTIPGSMANYLFDKEKYPYSKLIELWISNAVLRKEKSDTALRYLNTDVLNNGFEGFKK